MGVLIKSTKAWHKLPCAHAQFFDKNKDGSPGDCASWHGYDRTVKMTFAGDVDTMGWIMPFGDLKIVKNFIEYYFDHTAVIPANDPRLEKILESNNSLDLPMFKARVLPYGVSMEMSSLFIWEQVNPYIVQSTDGRCYLEKVESIEHDSNSAFVEVDKKTAINQGTNVEKYLICKDIWEYDTPETAIEFHNHNIPST